MAGWAFWTLARGRALGSPVRCFCSFASGCLCAPAGFLRSAVVKAGGAAPTQHADAVIDFGRWADSVGKIAPSRAITENSLRGWLLLFLFPFVACGEPATSPPPSPSAPAQTASRKSEYSGWVFSLLPTAFQKDPVLYQTVITEATDLGKTLPPVSAQTPAYYVACTAGPLQGGDVYGGNKPLNPDAARSVLARSLAQAGFYPAQLPSHPPTLLIVYTWGSFNMSNGSPMLFLWSYFDRAALVGGAKFVRQVQTLIQNESDLRRFYESSMRLSLRGAGSPVLPDWAFDFASPINLHKRSDPRNEFLWDQACGELYFVVASAYDYKAAATKERKLLWRTRMTVSSVGVSEEQSLPTLILSAAPFFGKDMAEPEVLIKREIPEGKVKIGTPEVVEMPAKEETPGRGDKP